MADPGDPAAGCFSVEISGAGSYLLVAGLLAIIPLTIVFLARVARRHPSRGLLEHGRRPVGVIACRGGLVGLLLGMSSVLVAVVVGLTDPAQCDRTSEVFGVVGAVLVLLGVLVTGAGWAYAMQCTWVVLATIAALDVLIFALTVLISLIDNVSGLSLLAFPIHAVCVGIAARWSYNARGLGPIEQAKAGEAGRAMTAVWVFLTAYTSLALFRDQAGLFDSSAGSAVLGALTLGSLAVMMGSGYTKYAEAIHSPAAVAARARPAVADDGRSADFNSGAGDPGAGLRQDPPAVEVGQRQPDELGRGGGGLPPEPR